MQDKDTRTDKTEKHPMVYIILYDGVSNKTIEDNLSVIWEGINAAGISMYSSKTFVGFPTKVNISNRYELLQWFEKLWYFKGKQQADKILSRHMA